MHLLARSRLFSVFSIFLSLLPSLPPGGLRYIHLPLWNFNTIDLNSCSTSRTWRGPQPILIFFRIFLVLPKNQFLIFFFYCGTTLQNSARFPPPLFQCNSFHPIQPFPPPTQQFPVAVASGHLLFSYHVSLCSTWDRSFRLSSSSE